MRRSGPEGNDDLRHILIKIPKMTIKDGDTDRRGAVRCRPCDGWLTFSGSKIDGVLWTLVKSLTCRNGCPPRLFPRVMAPLAACAEVSTLSVIADPVHGRDAAPASTFSF